VLTNEWHGLIWSDITPSRPRRHAGSLRAWRLVLDIYDLRIYCTHRRHHLLIIAAARFSPEYRQQTIYLLVGAAIPWIANIAYLSGLTASIVIDLTPIAFCLTSVIYAYQVFRFHLFSMVPVAHDSIVEGMIDGIVVLALQARVLYINPAAQKILKVGNVLGKSIEGDIIDWPAVSRDPAAAFHQVYEIQAGDHTRRYLDCHASPLYDHHGHLTGQSLF